MKILKLIKSLFKKRNKQHMQKQDNKIKRVIELLKNNKSIAKQEVLSILEE